MVKQLIPQEIAMLVSSNPAEGAYNISSRANSYDAVTINLQQPLKIPSNAINCQLKVLGTNIWNNTPNIIANENDKLLIIGKNSSDVITNFLITIPEGSYSVSDFNQAVLTELANQDAQDGMLSIQADDATSKVEIRLNFAYVGVSFAVANSCYEILGFLNTSTLGSQDGSGTGFIDNITYTAPNIAKFNVINYYLIASDLVSQGLRFNNDYRQIINQTNITVRPGSLIVYEPNNPSTISCQELVGQTRSSFNIRLLKDDFSPANTRSEYFSVRMSITYLLPIEI